MNNQTPASSTRTETTRTDAAPKQNYTNYIVSALAVIAGLIIWDYGFGGTIALVALGVIAFLALARKFALAGIVLVIAIVMLVMSKSDHYQPAKTGGKDFPPHNNEHKLGGNNNPPTLPPNAPYVPQVKIVQYKDILVMNGANLEAGPHDIFASGNIGYGHIDPRLCGQDGRLLPQHKDAIRAAVALAPTLPAKVRIGYQPTRLLQVQLEATRKVFHDLGDDGVILTPHRDPRAGKPMNHQEQRPQVPQQRRPQQPQQVVYRTRSVSSNCNTMEAPRPMIVNCGATQTTCHQVSCPTHHHRTQQRPSLLAAIFIGR